ncbi:GPO family capsid scaffolding protein [Pseudodesulfovibrio sp.]|uniref:GPO family capsid scaffolding protein n=1 Tax=unclassified Pseudodesulfovibrio TaxID=2661612 RepID=UPI003B008155
MPNTLITDWKKVGQSGPTADGRFIKPEWLEQAASNYDAKTVYTALLWPEHMRWFGNFGAVAEVKSEREGDIVSLYCRLRPGEQALLANKNGQRLFTSMELTDDFAETGECYLTGLGLTDSPASLGTQELSFSHKGTRHTCHVTDGVEIDFSTNEKDTEPPSWFFKAVQRLGLNIPHNQGATPEPQEEAMDATQFSELMGEVKSIGERQEKLEKRFAAQLPAPDKAATETGADAGTEDGKQTFSAEITAAIKPVTEKLDKMEAAFAAKVEALTNRFEQVNPGTPTPETAQPADPGADLL